MTSRAGVMLAGLGGLHIAVANDNKEITVHSGHF
jgi:hypothetical protein